MKNEVGNHVWSDIEGSNDDCNRDNWIRWVETNFLHETVIFFFVGEVNFLFNSSNNKTQFNKYYKSSINYYTYIII